jgi:hypothetical protein
MNWTFPKFPLTTRSSLKFKEESISAAILLWKFRNADFVIPKYLQFPRVLDQMWLLRIQYFLSQKIHWNSLNANRLFSKIARKSAARSKYKEFLFCNFLSIFQKHRLIFHSIKQHFHNFLNEF